VSNILITGATGFVGKVLQKRLSESGHTCFVLSTSVSNHSKNIYKWNPELEESETLPHIDYSAVINLAGASINDTRWNVNGKKLILESRVNSTLYLIKLIQKLRILPKQIISASAIGIYGIKDDKLKTEDSLLGSDFAAKVCIDWEASLLKISTNNTKVSIIRIGIVLGNRGGFYEKIKNLAKWKLAAPLASGNQPVSWIHVDDLVNVFLNLVDQKIAPGVYNAVTGYISNKDITKKIAKTNGQAFLLPSIPTFLLKILFGQKTEIFTGGTRVSNQKLVEAGFIFEYATVDSVMKDLNTD